MDDCEASIPSPAREADGAPALFRLSVGEGFARSVSLMGRLDGVAQGRGGAVIAGA